MSKTLKLFLGASYLTFLVIFIYLIFSQIDLSRLNDFTYYKEVQEKIEIFISKNFFLKILIFSLFCILWVSLLGFGSPLLIISGILFGKWLGTLISVFSISVGALILYIISKFFFNELIKKTLSQKFLKYIGLFKKNELTYFFAFRLAGGFGIPFGLQNVLPVIFDIKNKNYFIGSLLGFVPMFFIMNNIGAGLNKYIQQSDNFSLFQLLISKEIFVPILLFVIVVFVSFYIRKKVFDVKN